MHMSVRRRSFLAGVGGALVAATVTRPAFAAGSGSPQYPLNRAPLQPAAFLRLPPGAVQPAGWLATQLDHQVNGLNGQYQSESHFLVLGNTGWANPSLVGWEEVPYWLRGYGDLGYVTGDAAVRSSTEQWVSAVLATQAADGF